MKIFCKNGQVKATQMKEITVASYKYSDFVRVLNGAIYTSGNLLPSYNRAHHPGTPSGVFLVMFKQILRENRSYFGLPVAYKIVMNGYGQVTRMEQEDGREIPLSGIFEKLKTYLEGLEAMGKDFAAQAEGENR